MMLCVFIEQKIRSFENSQKEPKKIAVRDLEDGKVAVALIEIPTKTVTEKPKYEDVAEFNLPS